MEKVEQGQPLQPGTAKEPVGVTDLKDCENCGQCCRIPGIFLPEQMARLAEALSLSMEALFRRYLSAELFSPGGGLPPLFLPSPVRAGADGGRVPTLFADGDYHKMRNLHCIFWREEEKVCSIYSDKPFGCGVLLCGKMTGSDPILEGKGYYYNRWIESQEIVFDIFPALQGLTAGRLNTASPGKQGIAETTSFLNRSNF